MSDIIDTGIPLPRIASIRILTDFVVSLEWAEGSRGVGRAETVDLAPAINTFRIYRPLRSNAALFSTMRLIEDGAVIEWDSPDLDMSAEMVEDLAVRQNTIIV